jgi:egghead protein (zeste-white 4 protein)
VVPSSYRTKSGALFKARALQYCLEEDVNVLSDADWIVHLDEETIVTEAAMRGILNFVLDGKHQFGQVSFMSNMCFLMRSRHVFLYEIKAWVFL